MDKKIKQYEADLRRYTKRNHTEKWTMAHNMLGSLYEQQALQTDGPHPAADKALMHNNKALEIITEIQSATHFGSINSRNSRMYQKCVNGIRADNLTKALACSETALRVAGPLGLNNMMGAEHVTIGGIFRSSGFVGDGPDANRDMAIRHYLAASQFFSKITLPNEWARVQFNIGMTYESRESGNKRGNFKVAVKYYTRALEIFTKADYPKHWADAHYDLAGMYLDWPVNTTNKSPAQIATAQSALVEKCIMHAELALEVYTEADGQAWGKMKTTLLHAYGRRSVGGHSEKNEKIEKHKNELLEGVDTYGMDRLDLKTPQERADRHIMIANEFGLRQVGSKADNLEKVIKHYKMALDDYSPTFMPHMWAETHMRIGVALLRDEKAGVLATNETAAIEHMNKSLDVFTESRFPHEWSMAHTELGIAYRTLSQGDPTSNRAIALQHFNRVIESDIVKRAVPEGYASVWFHLGRTYHRLDSTYDEDMSGTSEQDDIDKSLECFRSYLDMSNGESYYWSTVNQYMSMVLMQRTRGDQAENINKSMEHYVAAKAGSTVEEMMQELLLLAARGDPDGPNDVGKAVLDSFLEKLRAPSKDSNPMAWAAYQLDLAEKCLKYSDQQRRHEDVEKAMAYCDSAMEVYTRTEFPEKWADVQMQLCAAYMQRAEGTRRENMENAMRCFEACKEVRPDATLPDEFLKKQWARGVDGRKAADRAAAKEKE